MKNCFSPKIVLDNTSRLPLQEQIAEAFRKHIARFRPEAGTRIISEHALSKELEIHRKTVHQAYEILVAEGFFSYSATRGVEISAKAKLLCRKPFPSIAFVMPYTMTEQLEHFGRWGYELFAGVIDRAAELGIAVSILALPSSKLSDEELELWLENSVMRNIGIIDLGPRPEDDAAVIKKLQQAPLPHVLIASESTFPGISTLRADYEGAYECMIKHLVKLKHKHIVCLDRPPSKNLFFADTVYLRTRIAGKIAARYGIVSTSLVIQKKNTDNINFSAVADEILKISPRPTAIICSNDDTAHAVIEELKSRNFTIPEDFSVLGYDRIIPGIAGCDHSRLELGRRAVDMIFEMDKNWKFGEFREEHIPSVFYEDLSSGCALTQIKNKKRSSLYE